METQIADFARFGEITLQYGKEVVLALAILVLGLIVAQIVNKLIKRALRKLTSNESLVSIAGNIIYFIIVILVVAAALDQAGVNPLIIRRILLGVSLVVAGLFIIFRPYIPTLPFKVGNTIMTGDLLGKVEATTFLNTRLRTFDGKTVYVPNSKILNDYLINYHFTPDRRFELDIGIGYDQDILKAKQILEAILIEDPRVLTKPRPIVYVVNLADSCVELSGRAWVQNIKCWKTKCDLLEKAKLRFDAEGIAIAFPQRDVHVYYKNAPPGLPEGGLG